MPRYLINLIDSPGHVDFTQEVSSALRLTDGCIVVVDAVEGVCIQTRVVLRQAWAERVKPVLFVNKLDKLYTKLEMDESQAFEHIKKVLRSVNEVTSVLWLEEWSSRQTNTILDDPYELGLDEDDGEYFSPSKGNVVFGSALGRPVSCILTHSTGGWGFRLENFVESYHKKLGIRRDILTKTLWGDYFFSPKKKMIYKNPPTGTSVPMFVNFILKPLWAVYGAFFPEKNPEMVTKILTGLNITMTDREFRSFSTPGSAVAGILAKWLPISTTMLNMVVEKLPNPKEAQVTRIPVLWRPVLDPGMFCCII